jgi:hypothetical protein
MNNYPQIAAIVLAKCAAYDPYLTEPTEEQARAWAEQFELYTLDLDVLLAAVTKVYSDNGSGYRPLPKDFTDAARAIRRDRAERESDAERRAREDRRDAELENRNALAGIVSELTSAKVIR